MAIFEDTFESYTVGDHPPIGSWTSPFDSASASTIIAGGTKQAGSASTKCLQIINGSIIRDTNPTFYQSLSAFFFFYVTQDKFLSGETINLFDFVNGPNSFPSYFSVARLIIEVDTTLSCMSAINNRVCNSTDDTVILNAWNFIQFNITLSTTSVLGVPQVHIVVHVGLNGKEVMSNASYDTGLVISNMLGTDSKVNIFRFLSSKVLIDNVTIDTLQPIITYPHVGTPFNKTFQGNAEIPLLPDSAMIQGMQGIAEFPILPDSTFLNEYQGVVELILLDDRPTALWKVREI